MNIYSYRNPCYQKNNPASKEWYTIAADYSQIEQYRDFYIISGVNPWVDVVECVEYEIGKDEFVCVTQRGSVRNAKQFIDKQYEL